MKKLITVFILVACTLFFVQNNAYTIDLEYDDIFITPNTNSGFFGGFIGGSSPNDHNWSIGNGVPYGPINLQDMIFSTKNGSEWQERMRIATSGNVGIGAPSVEALLEVNTDTADAPTVVLNNSSDFFVTMNFERRGVARANVGIFPEEGSWGVPGNAFAVGSYDGEDWTDPFIIENAAPTGALYVDSTGNVGIGTTSPGAKLHIATTTEGEAATALILSNHVEAGSWGGSSISFKFDDTEKARIEALNDEPWSTSMRFYTNAPSNNESTEAMRIRGNGNVGIGNIAPTEKLDVTGNIVASGTVTQGSSREFKRNIRHISTDEAMEALNKLNPVGFEYKADGSSEEHLGFIAEDVPELVASKDRKHLNAMDMTSVLVKVVQEQQSMLKAQQKEIEELKARMSEL